ncbi:hypothetical protein FLM52_13470 [bacterium Scap17]|nr:hypothetical protein [bacterium Scap17]
MSSTGQYIDEIKGIIERAGEEYNHGALVNNKRLIPSPENIPQRNNSWIRINGVISVFVDMAGSTKLSATRHEKSTAEIYQYFTGTMCRVPDDRISQRSYPLLASRELIKQLIQEKLHGHQAA